MRNADVKVGGRYLTRSIRVPGLFGMRTTRGEVQVQARSGDTLYVKWLMTDGSERTDRGLPRKMKARRLLTEVKST